MAGTGPAPNPNSRRQAGNQSHTWLTLPAAGYAGPVPDWPLASATESELDMWARYWRKPQAAAWAAIGMVDEVALYVRAFVKGATAEDSVKAITEARQWTKPLGLTPDGMLHNRWRMAADEVAERRTAPAKVKAQRRLKVADGGVAGS